MGTMPRAYRAHTHTRTHTARKRRDTRAALASANAHGRRSANAHIRRAQEPVANARRAEPASGPAGPSAARATLRSVSEPGLIYRRAQRCYAQSRFQIGLGHDRRNALSGAVAVPLVCCPPCATELSHAMLWLVFVLHTLLRHDIHRREPTRAVSRGAWLRRDAPSRQHENPTLQP